jgi:hypothetical protein
MLWYGYVRAEPDVRCTDSSLALQLPHVQCVPVCLQDAESQELALEAKRAAKLAEADEMAARLAELDAQLDDKRAEGEDAATRKAAVVSELEVLLAEQDTYKEALTKVFNRCAMAGPQ